MRSCRIIVAMAFVWPPIPVLIAAYPTADDSKVPIAAKNADRVEGQFEFRKAMTIPAANPNDFRHAVLAVSNEQKALLSRNLIVADRDDPKANSSGLYLWSLENEKLNRTRLGDSTTIGFVPKSTMGYSVNWGDGVVLWDTRTHTKIGKPFPHELREDTMPHPAVSPDGEVLVTRSQLTQLQFWEMKTRKPIAPAMARQGIVWKMEFSADGKWLFSENDPSELKVWAAKTGKLVAGPYRHDAIGDAQTYSPKAQQLATIENGKESEAVWQSEAVIRSIKDWSIVQRVKLTGLVREVKWIDDTHLLMVADDKAKRDEKGRPTSAGRNLLHAVSLNGRKSEVQTLVRDGLWIGPIRVAPNGKRYITSTSNGIASCWKCGEKNPIWTKPGRHGVHFGDGNWVLLTSKGGAIVYSLADGNELWRRDKFEDVKVQGSDIWVFGQKSVEVLRVSPKVQ